MSDEAPILLADWADLYERLQRAEAELRRMSAEATPSNVARLRDKASGVALAMDYVRGYGHHESSGSSAGDA